MYVRVWCKRVYAGGACKRKSAAVVISTGFVACLSPGGGAQAVAGAVYAGQAVIYSKQQSATSTIFLVSFLTLSRFVFGALLLFEALLSRVL